jgi:hypothetical protein
MINQQPKLRTFDSLLDLGYGNALKSELLEYSAWQNKTEKTNFTQA